MNKQPYSGPKYLYKYRPFDDHAFDMFENDTNGELKRFTLNLLKEAEINI